MRRATPYVIGLVAVAILAAAVWWVTRSPGPPPMPRNAHAAPATASLALPLLAAVLAGIAGGALAGWLTGSGSSRQLEELSARIAKVEREQRSAAQRHEQASRILATVGSADRETEPGARRDSWFSEGRTDPARAERPIVPPARGSRAVRATTESIPEAPGEPIEAITARFARIAAGQISRSGFARFFDDLGPSGGVRADRAGSSIAPDSSGEALLTSVNSAGRILVFPSYEFVSNQPTQFATIASVPDEVASVFELSRGDGELAVLRPALFEDADGEARLVSKGELGGFAG